MDNTSYSDPSIIDTVNKHFIPIRVDTDKRPDVNRRYNMGGWPTTAFLDGEGKIITGGTYIPPQQLREVLRSVLDYYTKNKGKAKSKLEPLRIPKSTGGALTEKISKDIATTVAVSFDIDYGGFGSEPKFPHAEALEYALIRYRYQGEKEMLTVVNRTLEKMGKGGIYDRVEDGFFRYSTTRDWSIPHFEKMAEDNAKLLAVYLHAYQLTGTEFFRDVAQGIVKYVQTRLSDQEKGGFYGSQDADEEYYKHGLEDRGKLKAPSIDKTLYSNYNALFVSSFLLASKILDKADLAEFALKTLDRITAEASTDEGVHHYWGEAKSDLNGLLVDYAWVLHALIDAYEHTGKWSYVKKASELARATLNTLYDKEGGGFFDIPQSLSEVGELRVRDKPMDENSAMAGAMLRLSWVTGEDSYSNAAKKTLETFLEDYERHGVMAAAYAIPLDLYVNGPIQITLVGPQRGKEVGQFKRQALKLYPARRSLLYLDPAKDSDRIKQLGYAGSGPATAYVCVGKVCGPPLQEPSQIEESLSMLLNAQRVEGPPAQVGAT